jgi:hypothetical protein
MVECREAGVFGAPERVDLEPFPHCLVDDWLDAYLYRGLCASFPTCPPNSGPTGYTLFWGDGDYDRLIASSGPWADFFRRVHCQEFIDFALGAFADVFAREATVDLSRARYAPYCESREDKQREQLAATALAPDDLWVRLDIMQGRRGYSRIPHLDHRRRALSMLVYFCDADEAGMKGGDLVLHGARGAARTVRPRHNRMVMFPCTAASLHSVSRISRQSAPRNFVQVTVSSAVDLWDGVTPPAPLGWRARARVDRLLERVGVS